MASILRVLVGLIGLAGVALGADTLEVRPDDRAPYFHYDSDRPSGAHGEMGLDVSVEGACGATVWAFERAEVVMQRARFGEVKLVEQPISGCTTCSPVRLSWHHEPTGYLEFEVFVFRRRVPYVC